MKRFFINFLGFAVVTAGGAFALHHVQNLAAVASVDEHAGHDHEKDDHEKDDHEKDDHEKDDHGKDDHGKDDHEADEHAGHDHDEDSHAAGEHAGHDHDEDSHAADEHAGHDHDEDSHAADEHAGHAHEEGGQAQEAHGGSATTAPLQERDPNRLWCREHGLYEDECTICHPEIAAQQKGGHDRAPAERDPNRLWCREHGLYEDECTICHPEIAAQQKDGHDHGGHEAAAGGLFCSTHQVPEIECGICQPQLAENLTPGQGMQVRLASLDSVAKAGIETGAPLTGVLASKQTLLCEATFDQNRTAHISPLAPGVIQRVHVDLGEPIKEGQILVEVASIDVAKAKSDYLKALDRERLKRLIYEREKDLVAKSVSAQQDFQQAEAEYQVAQTETMTARQQLMNYGLTDEDISSVRKERSSSSVLRIRAPFAGTLVEKHAVLGEAVEAGQPILQVVDLSQMWLELSIPESWIAVVKTGQAISATFAPLPGFSVEGVLTWISPTVDQESRMLKARAEVPNVGGVLKQGLYGEVRLQNQSAIQRLLIPEDSVQKVDGRAFVFVKKEEDLFELRHIALGNRANQQFEVVQGLLPDDRIVIAGGFTLKSEFLKSRFGAGCAHD